MFLIKINIQVDVLNKTVMLSNALYNDIFKLFENVIFFKTYLHYHLQCIENIEMFFLTKNLFKDKFNYI